MNKGSINKRIMPVICWNNQNSDRKSQIAVFIALALLVLVVVVFAMTYIVQSSMNSLKTPGYDAPSDLSNYLESCYSSQQSCALRFVANMQNTAVPSGPGPGISGSAVLNAYGLQSYSTLEDCKARLESFLKQASAKCSKDLPDELASKYELSTNARLVEILFAEANTAVHTVLNKNIQKRDKNFAAFEFYTTHAPRFKKQHTHATMIKLSPKVRFDYLKKIPTNQTIYRSGSEKRYVLDDPLSYEKGKEYLVIFSTYAFS